jgi:hypothetical protein
MSGVTSLLSSAQITSLIQQASTAYQAPAAAVQAQEQPIQAQISALGKIQGALSSLQPALGGLADVATLAQRSVTTSPTGAVSATVTNAPAPGTYNLANIQLTQARSLISGKFSSADANLGAGSISVQVGTGPATIAVASGQDTLSGIANAINQANAGVEATVVYDGTSYYLSLTGQNIGAAGAFTVTGSGGLAGFSYSPGGATGFSQTHAATNASFLLNGIPITSASNTVTGVGPWTDLGSDRRRRRHRDRQSRRLGVGAGGGEPGIGAQQCAADDCAIFLVQPHQRRRPAARRCRFADFAQQSALTIGGSASGLRSPTPRVGSAPRAHADFPVANRVRAVFYKGNVQCRLYWAVLVGFAALCRCRPGVGALYHCQSA